MFSDDKKHIIDNLRRGNDSAIKQLYDSFFFALCAYGSRFISEEDIVADIVQDTFVKLWMKRKDFYSWYSLRSFLYTAVRNACLNEIRQQNQYKHEALSDEFVINDNNFLIEEEVHRLIHQEINRLPGAMKSVFEMTLQDMSISEIAQALHISENTVRNQRAAARKKLQEKLSKWIFSLFF